MIKTEFLRLLYKAVYDLQECEYDGCKTDQDLDDWMEALDGCFDHFLPNFEHNE